MDLKKTIKAPKDFLIRELRLLWVLVQIAFMQVASKSQNGERTRYYVRYIRHADSQPSWKSQTVLTLEVRGMITAVPNSTILSWGSETEAPEPPRLFGIKERPLHQLTLFGWSIITVMLTAIPYFVWSTPIIRSSC